MKRTLLIFAFILLSILSINAQTIVSTTTDEFGNYVQVENKIESTWVELSIGETLINANLGKVGFFESKYTISFPERYKNNILSIDEKNLKKMYESIDEYKDVNISGARVYASNKWHRSTRVKLNISYKVYLSTIDGYPNDTIMAISQETCGERIKVLGGMWILRNGDIQKFKNVLSKYIKK